MVKHLNRIMNGDCIKKMRGLDANLVDLCFADPPFNIGYEYDVYDDSLECEHYLEWSKQWMTEVKRVLKPYGAFWLAIGDEYAAELKVLATRELGFHCRSWVIWYYTFGVHCTKKFTRSHTHLMHFVKDPKNFTFNDSTIRVPSARQLIYADKRANPKGRVPDDTWLIRPTPHDNWTLRPQDLPQGFSADSDTWYFPRVCGTFKERAGFHGCQMPEQVLGRIVRSCSNEGDIVFDPFVGSGTTLAVAKKLNREYIGCELSKEYVTEARKRIASVCPGELLTGSEMPLETAATTLNSRSVTDTNGKRIKRNHRSRVQKIHGLSDYERAITTAFEETYNGYSSDRIIADPELNNNFITAVEKRSVVGSPFEWNKTLFNLRKANKLKHVKTSIKTILDAKKLDACEFASEIALKQMKRKHELSLDDILCHPEYAQDFDQLASEIAGGFNSLYYRWAAFRIRKDLKTWRKYGTEVSSSFKSVKFIKNACLAEYDIECVPETVAGLYRLRVDSLNLYIGETANIRQWITLAREACSFEQIAKPKRFDAACIEVGFLPDKGQSFSLGKNKDRRGVKSVLIGRHNPEWNLKGQAA